MSTDKWNTPVPNKYVRESNTCPLCKKIKTLGLITCWPCYRKHGLRNGNPEAEAVIAKAEEEWVAITEYLT
jgi:hypothetical protein